MRDSIRSLSGLLLGASLLVRGATAQDALVDPPGERVQIAMPLLQPLHQPCSDERQGDEVWAFCLPGWKARFDDGITFHPGWGMDAPGARPFHWRSRSLTVGNAQLPLTRGTPSRSRDDHRYSLDYGPVVEHYDIRKEGVEQSFVVLVRPAEVGDLVIEGEITTELRTNGVVDADGNLAFVDAENRTQVVYGKAIAFDAAGRRAAVRTTSRNGRIVLTLAAEWLAMAEFPVTIDPLIATTIITGGFGACPGCTFGCPVAKLVEQVVSRLRHPPLDHLLVVWQVSVSTGSDVLAYRTDAAWQSPTLVFSRLGGWASNPAAAYTYGGTDRWVIAWEHRTSATSNPVLGIYSHWADDPVPNNGVVRTTFQITTGSQTYTVFRRPAVGGTISGTYALVVAEAEDPSAPISNTQIAYFQIYSVFPTYSTLLYYADIFHEYLGLERRSPSINTLSESDSDPWMIAWHEKSVFGPPNDNFDIVGCTHGWFVGTSPTVGLGDLTHPGEKTNAKVNGKSGRFLVTHHLDSASAPDEIRGDRVWVGGGVPSVVEQATLVVDTALTNLDLAFDYHTFGQFCALFRGGGGTFARRLDWDFRTIEQEQLDTNTPAAAVTYCPVPRSFRIAYTDWGLTLVSGCLWYVDRVSATGLPTDIATKSHTSSCAATLGISTAGTAVLGGAITTSLSGGTGGVPMCGFGIPVVNTGLTPVCGPGCWILGPAPGIGDFGVGGSRVLSIPTSASLVGARVDLQTAELFMPAPACLFLGLPLRLSDIHSAIIGS